MEDGVWVVFCNNSECSHETAKACSSGFLSIVDPYSCVNNAMIISVDIILLLIFFSIFIYKLSTRKTTAPAQSQKLPLELIFSVIFNGTLSLAYLGWGISIVSEKLYEYQSVLPLHIWLVMFFQGFTWLLLGLTISLNKLQLPHNGTMNFCYLIIFYAGFLCISSMWKAIVDRAVSIKIVLDLLSFPGAILLLFCVFQEHSHVDTNVNNNSDDSYELLQGEEIDASDEISSKENVTPFAKAGLLSTMSFWWLNPLMQKGKERILKDEDIPQLRSEDQAQICYSIYLQQMSKHKQKGSSDSPSMLSVILLCQWKAIIVSGFFALIKVLTLSAGPLFLRAFIKVASGKETIKYEVYVLTGGLFLAKYLESLSERQWYFRTRLIGLQVRSMLSAAIYQKQLRLSNAAKMTYYSPGEIVSYVTVDAYKIGEFPYWFHQIWTTSFQLCIALVTLYYSVGLAAAAALIAVLLTVLASSPLSKLQHKYQIKLMVAQDRRLKAITEALTNMKVLKLYAWETHFKNVIEGLRKEEFKWILKVLSQKGYYLVLFYFSPILVPTVTFWACYFLGIPLTASNVFTFLASLQIAQEQIRMIPEVAGIFIEAKVSFSRIEKFLEAAELENTTTRQIYSDNHIGWSIFIRSAEISWDTYSSSKATVRNINLMVKPGKKVAICGKVGSGKSTLLAAILGEVPKNNGTVHVCGKIAYVSQTAWIQTGTIQENILFGSSMDPIRYQEVIEKSCLVKDLEMLPFGDLTEIGERGVNLSGGQKQRVQLARALYKDADVYLLDDPFSAVDAHTATSLFNDYVMGALSMKTVLLVTHQVDFLAALDLILLMAGGEILEAATYDNLLASTPEFQDLVNAHKNTAGSERQYEFASLTTPVTSKGEIQELIVGEQLIAPPGDQLIKKEEREIGDTGLKPYLQYLRHNKGYLYFSLQSVSHMLFFIIQVIQSYWLAVNVHNSLVSRVKLIAIYSVIGCFLPVLLLLRSFSIVVLGCKTSESIFSALLRSFFQAPMSFYDSTPLGRILSRVSSDMSIVDIELAYKLSTAVGSAVIASSIFLILGILAWPVIFVIIPMIYLTIFLQRYYLASAKELMRMNGTTKSSIASHVAESIAGAITIRAFGQEDGFFSKYLKLIDANACSYFHSSSADEWLVQRLQMPCAIVLSFSTLFMTLLPLGPSASGFLGMALSYGLSMNISLVSFVQYHCSAANFMVSVERLEQYMHIPSEAQTVVEDKRPAHNWPAIGKVEIYNLKVKYRPDAPLVLRGISCIIEGGQKIGIVGRTGSGKTTLISVLFRLVEPTEGKIIIDNLNISTIGLHDLRSHLGLIPQDATLFSGTVRYNLDPLSQYTDREIWEVLGKCNLREVIQEREEGLDSLVVEDGLNWSLGQRQLFCLGRALLKKSCILVLDEATASIDNLTDSIIQKTIRKEFADYTVITVAHRIPTVMNCNAVLVISDGRLVEHDEPVKLINKEGSLFGQLVMEYWSHSANSSLHLDD